MAWTTEGSLPSKEIVESSGFHLLPVKACVPLIRKRWDFDSETIGFVVRRAATTTSRARREYENRADQNFSPGNCHRSALEDAVTLDHVKKKYP